MTSGTSGRLTTSAVVGLCAAAFGLRLGLARGDLWGDEAASVTLSLRSFAEMIATLREAEPHPPFFPVVLTIWMRLAGSDEFAVRFPSLVAGTLLVPFSYVLTRSLFGRGAVAAAAFTGVSPLLVWYATEARMYSIASLGVIASWYLLIAALRTGRRASALSWALALSIGLMTHYFTLTVAASQAAFIIHHTLRSQNPPLPTLRMLAPGMAIVGAIVGGWLLMASRITIAYYGALPGTVDFVGVASSAFAHVLSGWAADDPWETASAATAVALLLVGIAARGTADVRSLLWLVAIPVAVGAVVSVWRPMFQERYLAILAPPLLIWFAAAMTRIPWRFPRAAALAAVFVICGAGLLGAHDPSRSRSGYSASAGRIHALARPGDAVVLTGSSQSPLYEYYGGAGGVNLPVHRIPQIARSPREIIEAELRRDIAGHDLTWLILYAERDYDPDLTVFNWLAENSYRSRAWWTTNSRLYAFAPASGAGADRWATLRLGDYAVVAALPNRTIEAGRFVPVRLSLPEIAPGLALRLRLVDRSGFIWGEIDEVVEPGEVRWLVAVDGGFQGGSLTVEAALYDRTLSGRDTVIARLGDVTVVPSDRIWIPDLANLTLNDRPTLGAWRLVGWVIPEHIGVGRPAYTTLIFEARRTESAHVALQAIPSRAGVPLRQWDLPAATQGTFHRIQASLPAGALRPEGAYQLALRITTGSTEETLPLGSIRVSSVPTSASPTAPTIPVNLRFGSVAVLRGATVDVAARRVVLQWEAIAPSTTGLHVFVHAVSPTGAIQAQHDGAPGNGASPSDGWIAGDIIDDAHVLERARGTLRLRVGLYDPIGGMRVPVEDRADFADLGEFDFGT